jgi:hypothetical protein
LATHTEAHRADLRFDAELVQERNEMGIGPVVEYNKAGIEIEFPLRGGNRAGIRMTANVIIGLEHGDVVAAMQMVCNDIARDTGSNNGNPEPSCGAGPVDPVHHCCGTLRSCSVS